MVDKGLVMEAGLTDDAMSVYPEIGDEGMVVEAEEERRAFHLSLRWQMRAWC